MGYRQRKQSQKPIIDRYISTGETINGIRCLRYIGVNPKNRRRRVEFLCKCGKVFVALWDNVYNGKTKSCGKCHTIFDEITNHIKNKIPKNRLEILDILGKTEDKTYKVKVRCYCGKVFETRWNDIRRKHTNSCGCSIFFTSNKEKELAQMCSEMFGAENVRHYDSADGQLKIKISKNRFYSYDILVNDKYIIEYNGVQWHPKSPDDTNFRHPHKKSLEECWNHDRHKEQIAKDNGYKYLEVWEDEDVTAIQEKIRNFVLN